MHKKLELCKLHIGNINSFAFAKCDGVNRYSVRVGLHDFEFNPHSGHVVAFLDQLLYLRWLTLPGGFKQAAKSVDKNLKKFT